MRAPSSCRPLSSFALLAALSACAAEPPKAPPPTSAAPVTKAPAVTAPTSPKREAILDPKLPSRRVFFVPPERTHVKMSPDGKRIAYVTTREGVSNVVVAKIDTPDAVEASTRDTLRGVRSYTWAMTGKHLVYRKDEDGTENYHLHALDVTTGDDRDLTPIPRVQARLEARSRRHPREVAIALNERDARAHDVFVVDVVTGKRRLVRKNDEGMAAFVYDDELVPRVGLRVDADGGTSYLVEDSATKRLQTLLAKVPFVDTQATSPLGIDAAKRELYLVDSRGRDTAALVAIDLRTRASRVVVDDGQADIEGATFDPTTLRPDAAQATYAEPRWHLASDALARDFEALRELAKGDAFDVVTRSLDDTRWLVAVSSPVHPTRYFAYDRPKDPKATPVARVLFSASKELEALEPSPVFSRVIRARDGLSLVSYLTLPRGADADLDGRPDAPLPMVLLVHGGPWARDGFGLSPKAQFLASRGYAVLSVNFRGSTGFGKAFVDAGDREWSKKMNDDLVDAVTWAQNERIAEPGRVAFVGTSYGGYAALAGIGGAPDKVACAVDVAGPVNVPRFLGASTPAFPAEAEELERRVGSGKTAEGRAELTKISPLTFASRITKPLLVVHGEKDPRVRLDDAKELATLAAKNGQPVTLVVFPNEGHGVARPENRLAVDVLTEAFLARCLGGRHAPVGPDLDGVQMSVPLGKSELPGAFEPTPRPKPSAP